MPTTPAGRGLGLLPDAADDRDHLYTHAPEAAAYKFVDLEKDPATPPVWDQGQLGSCTAHGTLACFLFASAKAGAGDPMLSRLQLYYDTRKIEGTVSEDAGAQIRDAVKAAGLGVAPEKDWPYAIAKFATKPPSKAVKDAAANVALSYQRVTDSQGGIQACLSEGFPVDIGVMLYESFEGQEQLASGVIPMPERGEQVLGGHCMAVWGIGKGSDWKAVGQFPEADDDTVYVKVRNSWGDGVYQRGYLLMPVAYLTRYGQDFWTIRRVS